MRVIPVMLTVVTVVLNLLSIALALLTVASVKLDTAGQIVCLAFVGVLIVNMAAIQFGARFGPGRRKRDDTASTFD